MQRSLSEGKKSTLNKAEDRVIWGVFGLLKSLIWSFGSSGLQHQVIQSFSRSRIRDLLRAKAASPCPVLLKIRIRPRCEKKFGIAVNHFGRDEEVHDSITTIEKNTVGSLIVI
jgi:hypothetical protein